MYIMALVQWRSNGIYEIGYKVFDEKVAKLAQDETIIVLIKAKFSKNAKKWGGSTRISSLTKC